jgi:hypothetical protein
MFNVICLGKDRAQLKQNLRQRIHDNAAERYHNAMTPMFVAVEHLVDAFAESDKTCHLLVEVSGTVGHTFGEELTVKIRAIPNQHCT